MTTTPSRRSFLPRIVITPEDRKLPHHAKFAKYIYWPLLIQRELGLTRQDCEHLIPKLIMATVVPHCLYTNTRADGTGERLEPLIMINSIEHVGKKDRGVMTAPQWVIDTITSEEAAMKAIADRVHVTQNARSAERKEPAKRQAEKVPQETNAEVRRRLLATERQTHHVARLDAGSAVGQTGHFIDTAHPVVIVDDAKLIEFIGLCRQLGIFRIYIDDDGTFEIRRRLPH